MRQVAYLLFALTAIGLIAAKLDLTEQQATTCDVLTDLNFERLPDDANKPDALPDSEPPRRRSNS